MGADGAHPREGSPEHREWAPSGSNCACDGIRSDLILLFEELSYDDYVSDGTTLEGGVSARNMRQRVALGWH